MPIMDAGKAVGGVSCEFKILFDSDPAKCVYFLRKYTVTTNSVTSITDTELDGTTPYVAVGPFQDVETSQIKLVRLCDVDDTANTRTIFYRCNIYLFGKLVSSNPVNADGSTYTITGTEEDCTPTEKTEQLTDKAFLLFDSAAAKGLGDASDTIGGAAKPIPADAVGATMQVTLTAPIDGAGQTYGRVRCFADGRTPVPGIGMVAMDGTFINLGSASLSVQDPGELALFKIIAEAGVTAVLIIDYLREY